MNEQRSADVGRDAIAGLSLVGGLLLPWNLTFGVGVPDSAVWLFAVVVVVSVLAVAALTLPRVASAVTADRLKVPLCAPYVLVVAGFLVAAVVQFVRHGGSGDVPPGLGPGAVLGLVGALLAAQPALTEPESRFVRWLGIIRPIGLVAITVAVVAVLLNLYWRIRYVVPHMGDPDLGGKSIAVVATAMVYAAVALLVVLIGLRWLLQTSWPARLAVTALGASTGLGMTVVWLLGVGRDIDAFHGIAQTTSTASVGFEGYLAWAAAAAIVGPVTLQRAWRKPLDADVWWAALRKCLVLIAVWCAGSGVLRIFDLIVAVSLDQPFSAYDSVALLAFDVLAAVLAVWLSVNLKNPSLHPVVLTAVCGVLFVQTICRVVVGVGLAPRILYVDAPADLDDAVYGNTLAHQITSAFDVVLCWLALLVTVAALLVGQFGGVLRKPTQSAKPVAAQAQPNQRPQLPTGAMPGGAQDAVTSQVWQRGGTTTAPPPGPPPPAPAAAPAPARPVPRIARPGQPATADAPPPADATQSGSAEQPRIARINQPPAPPGP